MKAIVVEQPGVYSFTEVKDPYPGERQLVVRVHACGICGTDLHIADGEFAPTPYPIIPGHEFSGEVVEVGEGVRESLEVGTRVAVDPSLFCGECGACRRGRGNLCGNWGAIGDTVDGAFAEYVSVPSANVYEIPESMSFPEAALVEPLSCAVHGVHRLGSVLGDSILVVGAGTMGLLLMQLLLRAGASSITVVDRIAGRLDVARNLGSSAVSESLDDLSSEHFDVVVDASGVASAMEKAFALVNRGGRAMVFGVAPADASIAVSPFRIYNDEITIVGSMAVLHSFGDALRLLANGAVRTSELLASPRPLDSYAEALEFVKGGNGVKTQLAP